MQSNVISLLIKITKELTFTAFDVEAFVDILYRQISWNVDVHGTQMTLNDFFLFKCRHSIMVLQISNLKMGFDSLLIPAVYMILDRND